MRTFRKKLRHILVLKVKNPKDMKRVVNLIKQNTSYRKGESRGNERIHIMIKLKDIIKKHSIIMTEKF